MRKLSGLILCLSLTAAACGAAPEPAPNDIAPAPDAAKLAEPTPQLETTTSAPTTTTTITTTTTAPPPSTLPPAATSVAESPCPDLAAPAAAGAIIRDAELKAIRLGSTAEPWTIPLGSELPSMAVGKRALFLGLTNGTVVALDPQTCAEHWRTEIAPANVRVNTVGDLVVADGPDFIGVLDADSGEVVWSRPQRFPFGVVATIQADVIVVTVEGFGVLGVDLLSGAQVFEWAFENAPLRNVTADRLHVYAGGKGIIARPLHGGAIVWESNVDADLLTASHGRLFAGKDDGTVTAFDATSGEKLWTQTLEGVTGYVAGAAVHHDEVHFLDYDARLHHLDLKDGSLVFRGGFVPGLTFPEFDDALVLVQDRGVVTALDLGHRERFSLVTGANGIDRFTTVEVFRNFAITVTWTEDF